MTSPGAPSAAPRASAAVAWSCAAALAVLAVLSFRHGQDLAVFWRAARRALAGEPLYPAADGFLAFRYAPGAALLFAPLAALPLAVAKAAWYAVSVACGGLAVRRLSRGDGRRAGAVAALALLALSRPLVEEFACAQVNLAVLLLSLLAFAWDDEGREVPAGLALAVATAVKLAPAILLADLALRRRWRALAGFGLGAALVAAAPLPFYGVAGAIEAHRAWIASLGAASPSAAVAGGNQSLFALGARLGAPAFVAAAAALALAAFALRRPAPEPRRALLLFATAMASPMGWIQNYVMALPALFAVARAGGWRAWAAAALGVLLLVPMYDVSGAAFERWFFDRSLPLAAMCLFFAWAARAGPARAALAAPPLAGGGQG